MQTGQWGVDRSACDLELVHKAQGAPHGSESLSRPTPEVVGTALSSSHTLLIPLCPQHLHMAETVPHVPCLIGPQTPHEVGVFAYLQMRELRLRRNLLRSRSLRAVVGRLLTPWPFCHRPGLQPPCSLARHHRLSPELGRTGLGPPFSLCSVSHRVGARGWVFPFFRFPTSICGMVAETPAPSRPEAFLCCRGNLREANPLLGRPALQDAPENGQRDDSHAR